MLLPKNPIFILTVPYFLDSKMTTFAICYVHEGFCIAADGIVTDASREGPPNENQQKIFPVSGNNFSLAYVVCGQVDDIDYDVVTSIGQVTKDLSESSFNSFAEYCQVLVDDLSGKIGNPKKWPEDESILPEFVLFGYWLDSPIFTRFAFSNKPIGIKQIPLSIHQGANFGRGSPLIPGSKDQRLAKYQDKIYQRFGQNSNLLNAAEYVLALVQANCDPCAAEIDVKCKGMGGWIHAADITPSGFRWRIAPKDKKETAFTQ